MNSSQRTNFLWTVVNHLHNFYEVLVIYLNHEITWFSNFIIIIMNHWSTINWCLFQTIINSQLRTIKQLNHISSPSSPSIIKQLNQTNHWWITTESLDAWMTSFPAYRCAAPRVNPRGTERIRIRQAFWSNSLEDLWRGNLEPNGWSWVLQPTQLRWWTSWLIVVSSGSLMFNHRI